MWHVLSFKQTSNVTSIGSRIPDQVASKSHLASSVSMGIDASATSTSNGFAELRDGVATGTNDGKSSMEYAELVSHKTQTLSDSNHINWYCCQFYRRNAMPSGNRCFPITMAMSPDLKASHSLAREPMQSTSASTVQESRDQTMTCHFPLCRRLSHRHHWR